MRITMKNKEIYFIFLLFLQFLSLVICADDGAITIPLGGNAYITKKAGSQDITGIFSDGLGNWNNAKTIISIYYKVYAAENYNVGLKLKVSDGNCTIKVSDNNGNSYQTQVTGTNYHVENIGKFTTTKAGYVKLKLQGITKSGEYFADVSAVVLTSIEVKNVSFISNPDNFYYGRRGPSTHWFWQPMDTADLEYFYNEVMVPKGNDPVSCYFMVAGFAGGYMGMQRNEKNSKRILFSVFSDYQTDDPSMLPDAYKIRQVKKGKGVTVQEFGNEGSGLQSFLVPYDWKTGLKYKFLIRGKPKPKSNGTVYTGWFQAPGNDTWILISSLLKPMKQEYLRDIYSFNENFTPDQGFITRKVYFMNQWTRNHAGTWSELLTGDFTDDATGERGREDYQAGLSRDKKRFYLRMGGFFNEHTPTETYFTRKAGKTPPAIDFDTLP